MAEDTRGLSVVDPRRVSPRVVVSTFFPGFPNTEVTCGNC